MKTIEAMEMLGSILYSTKFLVSTGFFSFGEDQVVGGDYPVVESLFFHFFVSFFILGKGCEKNMIVNMGCRH